MRQSAGRILYVAPGELFKAINYKIYSSNDSGNSWLLYKRIPVNLISKLLLLIPLYKRSLRKGVHKMLKYENTFIVFVDKLIYKMSDDCESLTLIGKIEGSRPLYPCILNQFLYYGEYKSNEERGPIGIHRYDFIQHRWDVCHTFHNIRHIHGMFCDPYTNDIWITTGDLDEECNIYITTNEFESVDLFVGGRQAYRAIYLHFTDRSIIYGTDAPNDKNYIYEVLRVNGKIAKRQMVSGPVFYGGVSNEFSFLSTAVEPSEVNETKFMELWVRYRENWGRVLTVRKDMLPKKIFQYGQIVFPEGKGIDKFFFYTVIAGKNHEMVLRLNFDVLKEG